MARQGVLRSGARTDHGRTQTYVEWVARIGMLAKGVVYGLVGIFAIAAATGIGGDNKDFKGAMKMVEDHWWGRPLLFALGVGLIAYAAWRGMQGILDPENDEDKPRVFKRIGYLISAGAHASLAYFAFKKTFGFSGPDGDSEQSTKLWAADIMSLPLGQVLIGLAAIGLIVFGGFQAYYGFAGFFQKKLKEDEMSRGENKVAEICAKYGHLARGVAFAVIGGFLLKAAYDYKPEEAKGFRGVMDFLEAQQFGSAALVAFAAGLIAYGVFMVIQARFRKVKAPQ